MKKIYFTAISLLSISLLHAQVGVNTETPKTTFHIVPTKTDGSTAEGIIAPNLSRAQLIGKDTRYNADQRGAIVYVTVADGTISTKTTNIDKPGYYYFDGSLWQPFTSGSVTIPNEPWLVQGSSTQATGNTQNIYQAGKVAVGVSLTSSSANENFFVEGKSRLNGTVGIGKACDNPFILDIAGDTRTQNVNLPANYMLGASLTDVFTYDAKQMGHYSLKWISDSWTTAGNSLWMAAYGGIKFLTRGVYRMGISTTGEIGINRTPATGYILAIQGNTHNGGTLTVTGATTIASSGTFTLAGNGAAAGKYLMSDATGKATWAALPAAPAPTVTTANNGLAMSGTTTQLGGALNKATTITGTTTNTLTLNVPTIIPSSGTFTLAGNGAAAGRYLASDAAGKATWTALPAAAVTTANNGLAMSGTTTQLGGTLNKATTITGTTTNTLTLNVPTIIPSSGTFTLAGNGAAAGRYLMSDAAGKATWTAISIPTVPTEPWQVQGGTTQATTNAQNIYQTGSVSIGSNSAGSYKFQVTGTSNITGNSRVASSTVTGNETVGGTLVVTGKTTLNGDLQYTGHGAANGNVLSSDASGNATWKNANMLSGSWFYLPSINLDMGSTSAKTADLFNLGVKQLLAAGTLIAGSPSAAKPTLPTTAAAYDYMVVGSSGHITSVSINANGVMTYTPTTINPPIDAYVNIIVRVK